MGDKSVGECATFDARFFYEQGHGHLEISVDLI